VAHLLLRSTAFAVAAIACLCVLIGVLAAPEPASALPCQTCPEPGPGPDPTPPKPRPPVPTPAPAPSPAPAPDPSHDESVTFSLTVQTDRGAVTDGSGIDCPAHACSRSLTYTQTCTSSCPGYGYATITLSLTPVTGYTAKWDGCTPHPDHPADCDVALDQNRTVSVVWTKSSSGSGVDATPLHDGGSTHAPGSTGTTISGSVETARTGKRRQGEIRTTLRYSFRRTDTWTEYTRLQVRHLPAGARIRVRADGFRLRGRASIAARSRTVRLRGLTGRRYKVGTSVTVRVSKPGKRPHTTRLTVRRARDPLIAHPDRRAHS
jgi:hypothetical protein